jgi:hypothetical protein
MNRLAAGLLLAVLAVSGTARAGSISVTVRQNGHPDLTRTYNVPDSDIGRIIAAWQIEANAANDAPAPRNFVLRYWLMKQLIDPTVSRVQSVERESAINALPAPAPITAQ